MSGEKMIRAFYRNAVVPSLEAPNNLVTAKIFYPAICGDTLLERNTGSIPVDTSYGAMPVVIIGPGVNLPFESYSWLGRRLAGAGNICVCYQIVGEVMPGEIHLTPGVDIEATKASSAFDRPACFAIAPLIEMLAKENCEGILAGMLDLTRIWFGGHSAGGTTALLSASRAWFEGVRGVFAYGSHTGLSTELGHPDNYVHPVKDMPVLLIGGTRDGCIANSAHRYGDATGDANGRVIQTFENASNSGSGKSYLALIEGANHFTLAHPADHSSGRGFIDFAEECDGDAARDLIAEMVIAFIREDETAMTSLLQSPMIADGRSK